METIKVVVETFGCACGYNLEIDQHPDYPKVNPMTEDFYLRRGWIHRGVKVGNCPNCHLKGRVGEMGRIIDPVRQSIVEIKSYEQVDLDTKPMLNANGSVITVQTGVEEVKRIMGDEIVFEEKPVMEVQNRELTKSEKQAEIEKINAALDKAEAMEHKAA